jgi:HAD superfamily hydrolase (TIGR01549 family)
MLRAVLFDLDDTLYDHTLVSRIALQETARHDVALARADFDDLAKVNAHWIEHFHLEVQSGRCALDVARVARWEKILEHFGGVRSGAHALAATQRVEYLCNERLIDGATETLEQLAHAGLRLAIVSNNTLDEQLGKLDRLAIGGFFDAVIVSADHGVAKPDAELFEIALREIECDASEAMHVGDNWNADVIGARNAGVKPIWFNRFGASAAFAGVDEVVRLTEILQWTK